MSTHSSILAWGVPWTEEPGGLQSTDHEGTPARASEWVGSCLTFGNDLSEETHGLTKQETLLGRGTRVKIRRAREPRRSALPRGSKPLGLQCWD